MFEDDTSSPKTLEENSNAESTSNSNDQQVQIFKLLLHLACKNNIK